MLTAADRFIRHPAPFDREFRTKDPAPLFRREFSVGDGLLEATLSLCALGIGEGFSQEMKNVSKEMQDEIPTLDVGAVNYGSGSTGGGILDFNTLVNAFKTALEDMTVELDDREVGKFVKKTVSAAIYYS